MASEAKVIVTTKTSRGRLAFGLMAHEYACKCPFKECTNILVAESFLTAYKKIRYLVDMPLIILSGHRCHRHNFDEDGVALSRHTSGEAVDIVVHNMLEKFSIDEIISLAKKAGFSFFKYYKSKGFIHLDVRTIFQMR